ncbi:MAG: anti-sigma factor family protein [Armatimonadota bacterium]
MECKNVVELIPEYSVDMLEGSLKAEMENHLAVCPNCSSEANKLSQVMALINNLDQADPPEDLWDGVYKQISMQKKRSFWKVLKSPIPVKPLRWSIGVSIAVLILAILFSRIQTPANQTVADIHFSDEFSQGHIIYTNTDLFADPASINFSAALTDRSNEGVRVQ